MNKKTFQKKWYYRLIQIIFFGSLILILGALIPLSIWALFYEDDIPLAGLFWVFIVIFTYWLIKRIFYYIMFKERIFGRVKKGNK